LFVLLGGNWENSGGGGLGVGTVAIGRGELWPNLVDKCERFFGIVNPRLDNFLVRNQRPLAKYRRDQHLRLISALLHLLAIVARQLAIRLTRIAGHEVIETLGNSEKGERVHTAAAEHVLIAEIDL